MAGFKVEAVVTFDMPGVPVIREPGADGKSVSQLYKEASDGSTRAQLLAYSKDGTPKFGAVFFRDGGEPDALTRATNEAGGHLKADPGTIAAVGRLIL